MSPATCRIAACRPTSTSTGPAASRLGITPAAIDNALYNAFGQRLVSTIFTQSNLYRVVLEVKPVFQQGLPALEGIYVVSTAPNGATAQVPLSSIARFSERNMALAVIISRTDLDVLGIIGIVLLIGIVKKNAIMMIDFALQAQRQYGMAAADAIRV